MTITESAVKALDLDDCLITAFNAARMGASRLLDAYADQVKGRWDGPVSSAEVPARDSEREIRKIIYEAFPDHEIYAGEGPPHGEYPEAFWRADPLDGAWSFGRGSPFFSISLSLVHKGSDGGYETLLGVVLAPVLMELFWAVAGGGAFQWRQVPGIGLCEGVISVSDCGRTEEAAVRTALADPGSGGHGPRARVQEAVRALAAEESVSLGLAYVAGGRAEAFFRPGGDPWAAAAGALLVSEAGGRVSAMDGGDYRPGGEDGILATNGLLHARLAGILGGS
ncbi:MAG: hypothetical protein LBT40_11890 [Deltaproteobacteria bacterium]|jgi:myo-inositol-1(or 4)-monophosphatase|nr:hypothetical protein [Deltaproteobacteria bacterium]